MKLSRPITLNEYIGQEKTKKSIRVSLKASKKRDDAFPHVLLHGGSGLVKTTFLLPKRLSQKGLSYSDLVSDLTVLMISRSSSGSTQGFSFLGLRDFTANSVPAPNCGFGLTSVI